MKKNVPEIREREGNEKSIPIIREWESEAFILENGREREFPLTPARESHCQHHGYDRHSHHLR